MVGDGACGDDQAMAVVIDAYDVHEAVGVMVKALPLPPPIPPRLLLPLPSRIHPEVRIREVVGDGACDDGQAMAVVIDAYDVHEAVGVTLMAVLPPTPSHLSQLHAGASTAEAAADAHARACRLHHSHGADGAVAAMVKARLLLILPLILLQILHPNLAPLVAARAEVAGA